MMRSNPEFENDQKKLRDVRENDKSQERAKQKRERKNKLRADYEHKARNGIAMKKVITSQIAELKDIASQLSADGNPVEAKAVKEISKEIAENMKELQ